MAGAWVLYISSDEVFSAKPGSFKPDDPPCPRGAEVYPDPDTLIFKPYSLKSTPKPCAVPGSREA